MTPDSEDRSKLIRQDRKLRKFLRITGVLTAVGVLLVGAFILIVLLSLPSMRDLKSRYFASRLKKPVTTVQPIGVQVAKPAQPDTASGSTRALVAAPVSVTTPPAPTPPVTLADYAVDRFVDRGDRTLNVCGSLVAAPTIAAPTDVGSFSRAVEDQITTGQPNAYAEAALAPLGALLQLPSVGAVAVELRDAQETGDLTFIQQAQFYSNVAFAAAEVYRSKNVLDLVSQHAYHLSVLARLARMAPSAANQPEFSNLCATLESATLNPMAQTAQSVDQERSDLLGLIGALGLAPQQVGFDPSLDTRLSISITPQRVTVVSPWMDSMYRSGLQLSAQPSPNAP